MDNPIRKSMRLKGYDYSQNGAYFVTICAHNRKCIFGEIVGQGLCSCRLTQIGNILNEEIQSLCLRYPTIKIPCFVIMPNHVHLIIELQNQLEYQDQQRWQEQSPCPTVGDIICSFKSISTKRVNEKEKSKGRKIFQYRYHDHIIRSEQEFIKIAEYIEFNPRLWEQDSLFST